MMVREFELVAQFRDNAITSGWRRRCHQM